MASRTTQGEDRLPAVNWPFSSLTETGKSTGSGRSRFLLIDSQTSTHRTVRSVLSEFEYELISCDSTSEALSVLSSSSIDLILIDYNAPEMGGVEFCRMLRQRTATQLIPVLVLSRESGIEREIAAIEAGANDFVTKPLQPRAFLAKVRANMWRKSVIESQEDSEAVLFSLAQSVEGRDPELGHHCERIAVMCAAMGASLGLPQRDILALQRGGYLHDVGKVVVPDNILFKPGQLTSDEWRIMKAHTERGEKICSSMRSMATVLPIIRSHHERWDGSGYPDGLKGENIPLLARILQIADIYDALTTARAYKPAMSPENAIRTLREEAVRGWREPRLVELFSGLLPSLRISPAVDTSGSSLRALANSLELYRKTPAHVPSGALQGTAEMKLVSGL